MNIWRFTVPKFWSYIWTYLLVFCWIYTAKENLIQIQTAMPNHPEPVHLRYDRDSLLSVKQQIEHGNYTVRLPMSTCLNIWKLGISVKKRKPKSKVKDVEKRHIERGNLAVINFESDRQQANRLKENNIGISTANVRAIKYKEDLLTEYLHNNKIDICVVTETWLYEEDSDWFDTLCLQQHNFAMDNIPRSGRTGGGVALVWKNNIACKRISSESTDILEHATWRLRVNGRNLTIWGMYHPPPSAKNRHTNSDFINQFMETYTEIRRKHDNVLVMGDLNLHLSDTTDVDGITFNTNLSLLGLKNHVSFPTHVAGNALDVLISDDLDNIIIGKCLRGLYLSDHCAVQAYIKVHKQNIVQKISYRRDWSDVNWSEFFTEAKLYDINLDDINIAGEEFENKIYSAMEKLLPLTESIKTIRKQCFWFTKELKEQKRIVRRRETIWRKYREKHQWTAFLRERARYRSMLNYETSRSIATKVKDIGHDTKKLYQRISSLTGTEAHNTLPENEDTQDLCNSFADFFINKVETIAKSLDHHAEFVPTDRSIPPLTSWPKVTESEILDILKSMPNKQCEQDKIPTRLLKDGHEEITAFLTDFCNASMKHGEFPLSWKEAYVKPLLKGKKLETSLKNYRPVSNLKFVSKVLEKVIMIRLEDHFKTHDLMPKYQSAYRKGYSCETALLKLTNDILWSMERGKCTAMVCIDLSAAFDLVSFNILINVLECEFGITDVAKSWLHSYLTPRGMKVYIDGHTSVRKELNQGVAQGSCLGPILYSCFASTLQYVIPSEIDIHGYADDHATKKEMDSRSEDSCLQCCFKSGNNYVWNKRLDVFK